MVDTEYDTAIYLDLRVVAGAMSFDWKQSADAVALTSTVVAVSLPESLVQQDDIVGYPLTVTGILRTDTTSQGIPTVYGTIDAVGLFTQVDKPEAWPYREALYPVRERPEAAIDLDDNGDDTGLPGGAQ